MKNKDKEQTNSTESSTKDKKPVFKHTKVKEEKHDWFIDTSFAALGFLDKNKKLVTIGIAAACAIAIIIAVSVSLIRRSNLEISDIYYDSTKVFMSELQKVQDMKLKGDLVTDETINSLREHYVKILSQSKSRPESHLSQYNLGLIYYSIQDYQNAIKYFFEAYENKSAFPFAYKALYNLGHSYYNLGFQLQESKEFDKAITNYQAAYDFYKKISDEFPDSPVLPLSYRYRGMVKDYIADCYKELNQSDRAKSFYEESKKEYDELGNLLNKDYQGQFSSLLEESQASSRIVEAKINKLIKK